MNCSKYPLVLAALGSVLGASTAQAAPALRTQVTQHGDFVMIGNAGGFECGPGTPAPAAGSTPVCPATNIADTSPDIYWRSQDPNETSARADATVTATGAVTGSRTTALLALPAGAVITYARVYWAGYQANAVPVDTTLTIERPQGTLNQVVTADTSVTVPRGVNYWYQSSADVTTLVKTAGPGLFRVSDIGSIELLLLNNDDPIDAWSMVVFYSLPTDPPRNLALFDGLDLVLPNTTVNATLSGFLVPNAGFDGKLGVIAYEGENSLIGDSLSFNGSVLSDLVNPATNFFNSSRSKFGVAVSVPGDLPQLSGAAASMSGFDLDVVDVKPLLHANDNSATIAASSTGDTYLLGAFVTSISTFAPDFSTSNKNVTDVNGGSILPGDELEYVITASNSGNDASVNTVVTDPLPAGVTYKAGTLQVTTGANLGVKTDALDTDQAEYDAMTRTVTVRVGTGATGLVGGNIAIGDSSEIRFRVTVDANATGSILNQAVVNGGGAQGAPQSNFPTDGNGNAPGAPPTTSVVDKCGSNTDCTSPAAPVCDTMLSPKVCVGCAADADCKDPTASQCNVAMHTCGCSKNCTDSDADGIPDDVETAIGTDPHDADSDDDGVPDGQEKDASLDTDGDGLINALDPDSDNDGLFDGTELGLDCSTNKDTDATKGHCRADADKGATVTNPLLKDTDGGGVSDGSEDFNLDGAVETGETDPTAGHGADDADVKDSDKDGLSDGVEKFLGSDPMDADSDDDGVRDGSEANPSDDTDGDGLNNVLDVDSDNDGLYDGTESGKGCDDPATNAKLGHCIADADLGKTMTSPLDPDTDHGGVKDGSEDFNRNGVVDADEGDPTLGHGADDSTLAKLKDSDGDGLSDGLEATIGTNPNDADSDNDGVLDGAEPNPADDTDGDGKINALDPDSDNDGLFDGTELGLGCANKATDAAAGNCVADGDSGTTRTNPLIADTDHGGVKDGDEDTNHNGVVDTGETDPNNGADDHMTPGSGGAGGASGAGGAVAAGGGAGLGGMAGIGATGGTVGVLEGGGCSCGVASNSGRALGGWALGMAGLGLWLTRRRRNKNKAA